MRTDDEPGTLDRVRYYLSSYFSLAVGACLLLAVAGVFVAVGAHSGPDTTTEQRVTASIVTDSHFEHAAVVQRDVRVFERGEVLRGRTMYFSSVTPILNGSYVYEYDGDADRASVTTDLRLVVQSTSRGEGQQILWRDAESVASAETSALGPGETHRVPFEFNVSDRIEFARSVRNELGGAGGGIEVLLVSNTTARATLDGERVVDRRTEQIEIVPSSAGYAVETNTSGKWRREVTETVEVPTGADPISEYGSVALALVGLVACAGLVWARRSGMLAVAPSTQSTIRFVSERDSFDEWVSVGRVPTAETADRVVLVDSLTDLVDVAIDSERRVIEDAESNAFVVFDDRTRYEFRPDAPGEERLEPGEADVDGQRPATGGVADALTGETTRDSTEGNDDGDAS